MNEGRKNDRTLIFTIMRLSIFLFLSEERSHIDYFSRHPAPAPMTLSLFTRPLFYFSEIAVVCFLSPDLSSIHFSPQGSSNGNHNPDISKMRSVFYLPDGLAAGSCFCRLAKASSAFRIFCYCSRLFFYIRRVSSSFSFQTGP